MASPDQEEDSADRHADDPDSLFTVLKAGVDLRAPVRSLNRRDGVHKVDAVFAAILGGFGSISLILQLSETTDYP